MPELADKRDVPLTASSRAAAEAFDSVVDDWLRFGRNTGDLLNSAAEADPDMAMTHCLQGYFFHIMGSAKLLPRARSSLQRAEAGAHGVSQREKMHVAALSAWCHGDLHRARDLLEQVLIEHPRDVLALKLVHFIHFYLGDVAQQRDSIARVMDAWDDTVPGYGYVLGMRAFGLEEAGEYETAEALGREAVERNADDIWAGHAVAHVFEMQGRHREGIDWIAANEAGWRNANNFAYHVWWHKALYHLALEEIEAVIDLYDRRIRADRSDDYLDISNAASLLLRLEIRGHPVGDRWDELADKAAARRHEHVLPFIDAHFMMPLAAKGMHTEAEDMLVSMRAWAAAHDDTVSPIMREVGIPLAEAVYAFGTGDYGAAVDLLLPIRYAVQRIGGSHAQRDIFQKILIEAALRDLRAPLARALLVERREARPWSPAAWKDYARVLDAVGDAAGAADARATADALLAA